MDVGIWSYVLLGILGIGSGFVNVIIGGGSNLTIPMLMIMGVPADVANGTNRLGVLMQCYTGARGLRRRGYLMTHDLAGILTPVLIGGALGSLAAAVLPAAWLKPMLLWTMLGITGLNVLYPTIIHDQATCNPVRVRESRSAWIWLLLAGFYGGFVQAGVGIVLVMILGGVLRYDILRASAIKLLCVLLFTIVSLIVFIAHGKVDWGLGLILAIGNTIGAALAVRTAINLRPITLKRLLFLMTLVMVMVALST